MPIRLNKVLKECNIGLETVVSFLKDRGFDIDSPNPNTKISDEAYALILQTYKADQQARTEVDKLRQTRQQEKLQEQQKKEEAKKEKPQAEEISTDIAEDLKPKVTDRKSTRLNSSHTQKSRMPSSA